MFTNAVLLTFYLTSATAYGISTDASLQAAERIAAIASPAICMAQRNPDQSSQPVVELAYWLFFV